MAEEKPHDATPSKLSKARKEGNVAKSNELNSAFSFAAGAFTALAITPSFVPLTNDWIRNAAMGRPFSFRPMIYMIGLMLIPMFAAAVSSAALNLLQTQGPISKPIKFDLKKLSPAEGFKKIFSKEGVVNAVRALICFAIAVVALKDTVTEVFARGLLSPSVEHLTIVVQASIIHIITTVFLLGLAFSGVDFFLTRQRWKKQLKMSNEEIKRDYKESNGDPQIKGKRKQFHRQLLRGAPAQVKDASVVVTNPTHFAVALLYDPPRIPVPRVLCRAADEMAFEVRRLADLHGVPMVENVPLARELFARGRAGREIPEDTFVAVAEIVAALLKDSKDGKIARKPVPVR